MVLPQKCRHAVGHGVAFQKRQAVQHTADFGPVFCQCFAAALPQPLRHFVFPILRLFGGGNGGREGAVCSVSVVFAGSIVGGGMGQGDGVVIYAGVWCGGGAFRLPLCFIFRYGFRFGGLGRAA